MGWTLTQYLPRRNKKFHPSFYFRTSARSNKQKGNIRLLNMDNETTNILSAISTDPNAGMRRLMKTYGESIYWHIRRLVVDHEDAQDATQETFIRAFRSLPTFRGDCKLATWLYRIATNEALRIVSARRAEEISIDSTETGAELLAADSFVDYTNEAGVRLQKAVLTLPPKQQLAFYLRYYDDMSFAEMAQVASSTPDSMKMSYSLAKEKIRRYIETHDL